MKQIITTSKRFALNWLDLGKSLLILIMTPLLEALLEALKDGAFNFDWKKSLTIGIGAALAYLIKNFFTPGKIMAPNDGKHVIKSDPNEDERVG